MYRDRTTGPQKCQKITLEIAKCHFWPPWNPNERRKSSSFSSFQFYAGRMIPKPKTKVTTHLIAEKMPFKVGLETVVHWNKPYFAKVELWEAITAQRNGIWIFLCDLLYSNGACTSEWNLSKIHDVWCSALLNWHGMTHRPHVHPT
jgi:hypothetical protein